MNIKSLLLGSAAALAAVTGARAADAVVVAEPEPVEYVRVCDTYGAGFYYIPGTETCMRIGGLLRYDIDWDTRPDQFIAGTQDWDLGLALVVYEEFGDGDNIIDGDGIGIVFVRDPEDDTPAVIIRGGDEGWRKNATARVNIDVRSETEFGTFRRFIRLEGSVQSGQNNADIAIRFAYIELGGLLVGLYDTLYDGTNTSDFDEGGGSRTHQIRYTFNAGNGIMAQVAVEEEDYNVDYTPNVVGKLTVTQGWGNVALFAAYDATAEEWAAKAMGTINLTDMFAVEFLGTYESGRSAYSILGPNFTGYEWSIGGALRAKVDKFTIWGGGAYLADQHVTGADEYRVGAEVDYAIVDNLLLRTWVRYNGSDLAEDYWDGRIRLESSF